MSASSSDLSDPRAVATAVPAQSAPANQAIPMRRIVRFATTVLFILLFVNGLVCATASYFFSLPGWLVWQGLPGSLAAAFVLTSILGFRYSNPLLRLIYTVSAAWLGALNFAFFAAVACWIVYGIVLLARAPVPAPIIALLCFGIALMVTVYGLINAAWTRISRITVELPNLPKAWQGHNIALVTDLHLGHVSGPNFLRRIISRLRSLQPDAVFIGGDMFDGTPIELDRLVAPWKDYSAPRGIYYVTGNHDEFADRNIYLDAVSPTGVRVLNNEKFTIEGLTVVGVHDSEAEDAGELKSILRRIRIEPTSPSILLAHRPVNLAIAEEAGISLQLSGHTHQGQLWPWNKLVSRIYGPFAYGLHPHGKLLVYTSCGVGTWGPPLRVGTRPEIVLIRLERKAERYN
jgi:predicted MPP superfamily phosphohydrolase